MKNTKLYTINCRYFVPVIPNDCFEVGHALDLLPRAFMMEWSGTLAMSSNTKILLLK